MSERIEKLRKIFKCWQSDAGKCKTSKVSIDAKEFYAVCQKTLAILSEFDKPVGGEYRVDWDEHCRCVVTNDHIRLPCHFKSDGEDFAKLLNTLSKRIRELEELYYKFSTATIELDQERTVLKERIKELESDLKHDEKTRKITEQLRQQLIIDGLIKDEYSDTMPLTTEVEKQKTEIERLREALGFYEDESNWNRIYDTQGHISGFKSITDDFDVNDRKVYIPGKRARQALVGASPQKKKENKSKKG